MLGIVPFAVKPAAARQVVLVLAPPSPRVWEGLGHELGRLFRERAACAGSQSADSLGCSLGALLAMPCPPSLPCPPCLAFPAFRHSVNLLCCWCHALRCDCNTPASNMSTVLAPFGPNSVGTSRRASSLADKGPGAESAESASQGQATSSPSQSGLPSSIDTTKLCPFEAAALAFLCRCCVISLPCSEAPCWAMLDACWHWQTPLPSSSPQLRRSGRDAPGARWNSGWNGEKKYLP